MWENTTPSTELPRDFSAVIGTLQLGFVLVSLIMCLWQWNFISLTFMKGWEDMQKMGGVRSRNLGTEKSELGRKTNSRFK